MDIVELFDTRFSRIEYVAKSGKLNKLLGNDLIQIEIDKENFYVWILDQREYIDKTIWYKILLNKCYSDVVGSRLLK